jgi:hypothetical protein
MGGMMKMELRISHQDISLENRNILGTIFFPDDREMGFALVDFLTKCYFFNRNFMGIFCDYFLPGFENAAVAHFTKLPIDDDLQQPFINSLTPIWNELLKNEQYAQAQIFWENVLQMVERLAEHFNHRIHKGAIFYYLGISAILNGEIEKGYRLMGEALAEDIETYKKADPDTPAYKFVHFDYEGKDQKFRYYLEDLRGILIDYLGKYKKENPSKLDSNDIQKKFLSIHPNNESVLLLNYSLARIKQRFSVNNSSGNFLAGILDLNLLFDLTQVIDMSLNPRIGTPITDFTELWKKKNSNVNQQKLGDLNSYIKNNGNIYVVISSLLSRNFNDLNWGKLDPIEYDIAIVYVIRNHSAHNIDPHLMLPINSYALLQSIFNVLFFTIDIL